MRRCDSEGATHHTGCECHEARRDAESKRLKAEVDRLRGIVEVNDQRLAAVWDESRAEVERLRGVVRLVHAMTGRDVDWAAFPTVAAAAIHNLHEFTKEEP